jgi:hypothetical protein
VIDLDLLVPDEPAETWPADARRGWAVLWLVLLVLLAVSGASAPVGPGLVEVRTATLVPAASYRILGDSLYIAEARPGGNWLTAYPLAAGPPRWSTRIGVLASNVALDLVGPVVLVGMFQPGVAGDHTAALDRQTGTVRWRSPLNIAALDRVRGRVVLTEYPAAGVGSGPPPARVTVVRAGTGEQVWTYRRESGCEGDLPYEVTRPGTGLAQLCQDGSLTVLDLDTGRVRASAVVPGTVDAVRHIPAGYLRFPFGARVAGLPDRVLVSYPSAGRTVLTSFRQDTLRWDWTTEVGPGNFGIIDCGPRICLGNSNSQLAVDRDTGRISWSIHPVGFASPLVDRYVLVAPAQLGDVQLVDVATGAVVMTLGNWTVETSPTGPPTFFRSDGATGHTWVARLSTRPAGIRVLGWVPDARPETCGSANGYLVCRTVKDTVAVWRFGAD